LRVQLLGNSIGATFFFRGDRFSQATMKCLVDQFVHLLKACLSFPEEPISNLEIVPPEERSRILAASIAESTTLPGLCLHELFSMQAGRRGDVEAVVFHDRRLTYHDLELESNRLANFLQAHGIRHEDRVGILMERSAAMIVSILAVLKAGGVYVPIDPEYPEERIRFIVEDTSLRCI